MFRQPIPALVFVAGQTPLANRPLPFVGVRKGVDYFAVGILQLDSLPPVAQHALPVTNDRLNGGIFGREDGNICRDDKIAMRREGCLREIKPHPAAQRPAFQIDRFVSCVVEFHKLLADILGRGVVMNFIDHHAAEQRQG